VSKLVSSRVSTLTRFASTSPSLLPSIGTALGLIHKTPEKPWTVPILAAQVGISRSPFAARLTVLVDQSSMPYVKHWRLQLAAKLFQDQTLSLSNIAEHFPRRYTLKQLSSSIRRLRRHRMTKAA
jgi:transcriptional regulator GlxA family with amidase domain